MADTRGTDDYVSDSGAGARLVATNCPSCHVRHAVPSALWNRTAKDGGYIYCPNGHRWSFKATEVDRLTKRVEELTEELTLSRRSLLNRLDEAQREIVRLKRAKATKAKAKKA